MDNLKRIEIADASARNRKNAVSAMCKVALLLITVTLLSDVVSFFLLTFVEAYAEDIQHIFVKILTLLGASKNSAYTAAKLVLGSEAFSKVISLVTSFVSLVVPAVIFSKLEGLSDNDCFNVKGNLVKGFIPVFCLCHLFTALASAFSGMISDFMIPGAAVVYEATGVVAHEFNIYEFVISILCTSIFVPVIEEYVFRGVIFSYLGKFGTVFGIVASSVIFGIAHNSPVQSVYALVFGLFSATLVAVTGNIKTSVLLHVGNNFLTVTLGYVLGELEVSGFNIISSLYLIVFSAIGIYGLYHFCKRDGIVEKLRQVSQDNDKELAIKPGIAQIIVFPLVLYILYYVYSVLMRVL